MKNKDYHIKITDEKLKLMRQLAIQDNIRLSQVFERTIDFYLRARKLIKVK